MCQCSGLVVSSVSFSNVGVMKIVLKHFKCVSARRFREGEIEGFAKALSNCFQISHRPNWVALRLQTDLHTVGYQVEWSGDRFGKQVGTYG